MKDKKKGEIETLPTPSAEEERPLPDSCSLSVRALIHCTIRVHAIHAQTNLQ